MKPTFECVPIAEIASSPDQEEYRPVVLVVDDETVIADTLVTILSRNGFAAIAAYEGASALEIAEAIPPNLLLSDIAMPRMTGIELAVAISNKFADCKILLFSGQANTSDLLSKAYAAGVNFPMLTKPIHPSLLLERIASCLGDPSPADAPAFAMNLRLVSQRRGASLSPVLG